MKIFLSSFITDMEPFRASAQFAIASLGHEVVMAENFGALPHSPEVACLAGVRNSAAMVLLLGDRYGSLQETGLSATHQEHREARGSRPVLAFIQSGITPDPSQAAFIKEVESWNEGVFRAAFSSPVELQSKVTGALHRMELAQTAAPFDAKEVLARAITSLSQESLGNRHNDAVLSVVVAGGPIKPY